MVEICSGLLLGGMSEVFYLLGGATRKGMPRVTHLLSIVNKPIDWSEIRTPHGMLTAKLVPLPDLPTSDLLSHLPSCVSFIDDGIESGTVLVHCEYGISRSVTVVTAYLMARRKLKAADALKTVEDRKPGVRPNAGFMEQLKLWEMMKYKLDNGCKQYRAYKLRHQAQLMKESGYTEAMDMVPDPSLHCVPSPAYYRCRKCRRLLFTKDDTLHHEPGDGHFTKHHPKDPPPLSYKVSPTPKMGGIVGAESSGRSHDDGIEPSRSDDVSDDVSTLISGTNDISLGSCTNIITVTMDTAAVGTSVNSEMAPLRDYGDDGRCSSVFIEPVEWMAPLLLGHKDGKIICPKCSSRIGSFDWAGCQCSCSKWVTPGFQIHKSKVDIVS